MGINLKDKTLNAIDFLLENQNEETLSKIEVAIEKIAKEVGYSKHTKPVSKEDLIERALIAEDNYEKGKYRTQEDLKKSAKDW